VHQSPLSGCLLFTFNATTCMQALLDEGRATARDEEAMKAKWIARCLSLHREKLEKAEGKAGAAGTRRVEQGQDSNGTDTRTYRNGDGEGEGEEGGGESDSDDEDGGDASGDESEAPEQAEKKFSGGFSLEQCVAAVRLKAREREEAAQNRNPESSAGSGGAGTEWSICGVV
jgi:hypothetical protein